MIELLGILIIIVIIFLVICVALYNTLIHLQQSCTQSLEDMLPRVTKCIEYLQSDDTKQGQLVLRQRKKAKSEQEKVVALEQFDTLITQRDDPSLKKRQEKMVPMKRFYTQTAKERNERIVTIPTNLVAIVC